MLSCNIKQSLPVHNTATTQQQALTLTKEKSLRCSSKTFYHWATRIRTWKCWSQNPVPYHLAIAQYSKNLPLLNRGNMREKIRTPDTLVRSQVLYPAELHTHIIATVHTSNIMYDTTNQIECQDFFQIFSYISFINTFIIFSCCFILFFYLLISVSFSYMSHLLKNTSHITFLSYTFILSYTL